MPGDRQPIPLTAHPIELRSAEFATISGWPFADQFVQRLLRDDIPIRAVFGKCQILLYRDPNGQPVGFGTIDICEDYAAMTGGISHPYIPLLAVNPTIKSLGYGTSILRHLIGEAAVLHRLEHCDDTLFLDVYSTSSRAKALYERADFRPVTGEIFDPIENKPYIVMARRVSKAAAAP